MLHRHRAPGIDQRPAETVKGMEHLTDACLALLRWLTAGQVEYVVVGAAGEAIRSRKGAEGPVAIVPAPYHRNLDRLARSLLAAHARPRGDDVALTVRFNAATLAGGERWELRCQDSYDLDLEILSADRYAELLYEAGKFEVAQGLSVEVASPEDLDRATRKTLAEDEPEIRISRGPVVPDSTGSTAS